MNTFCKAEVPSDNLFRIPVETMPNSISPYTCSDYIEYIVCRATCMSLCYYDNDAKTYVPRNRKVKVSDDALVYDFYLDEDLYWNNGELITAYDFVRGVYKVYESSKTCPITNILYCVSNWAELMSGEVGFDEIGIKAYDDIRLHIELEYPVPYLYELLSTVYMVPFKKDCTNDFPLCSGPYYLDQIIEEQKIILKRNISFHSEVQKDTQKVDMIILEKCCDMFLGINKYEKGYFHMTCSTQFPFEIISKYLYYEDFHIEKDIGLKFLLQTTDTSIGKQLKEELRNSINTDIISNELYNGITPWKNFFGKENEENSKQFSDWNNRNIELIYSDYYPNEFIALKLKEQWEDKLNINILLIKLTLQELVARINNSDFDLALDICMFPMTHPMAMGMNFLGLLPDDEADKILSCYEDFLDGRELDIQKTEYIFSKNLPIIPLFTLKSYYFLNPYAKNFHFSGNGNLSFEGLAFSQ